MLFPVPTWIMAAACFLAALAAIGRSRVDRRIDGYIGHAIALLWLGTVYSLSAFGWVGLDDPDVRARALRVPVLLLVGMVGQVHFLVLGHGRRSGGKRG